MLDAHRHGWVLLCASPHPTQTARHIRELAAHGVLGELQRRETTYELWVRREDLDLAASLCGIEVEVPSASRTGRYGVGAVALAAFLAGASALGFSGSTDASHWAPSGRAFHADDDADGTIDRIVVRGSDGVPRAVLLDEDRDGVLERFLRLDGDRATERRDLDGDGLPEGG